MDKKYKFLYITTHIESGKYYIGKHETNKLNDGYLGSGKLLKRAIKKYGKDAFKQEIICFCNTNAFAGYQFPVASVGAIFFVIQTVTSKPVADL